MIRGQWSPGFVRFADFFTQFGLGGWYLIPSALLLVVANLIDWRSLSRRSLMLVYNWTCLAFLVLSAVGLSGLLVNVLKYAHRPGAPALLPGFWRAVPASLRLGCALCRFSIRPCHDDGRGLRRPSASVSAALVLSRLVVTACIASTTRFRRRALSERHRRRLRPRLRLCAGSADWSLPGSASSSVRRSQDCRSARASFRLIASGKIRPQLAARSHGLIAVQAAVGPHQAEPCRMNWRSRFQALARRRRDRRRDGSG